MSTRRTKLPLSSRVCNTMASGPNSLRTKSSACRMVFARNVLISMDGTWDLGLGVQGSGFRLRVSGFRFQVLGFGFLGFWGWG